MSRWGKRRDLDHPARLVAYEQVNRGLAAEFPTVPAAVESLVQIAKDSPPAKAQAIARDVLAMPASPEAKAAAQSLLDRYALVGRSLPELLKLAFGPNNVVERSAGRPVVIYTWDSFSQGSIALAKDLAAKGPAGATLTGLCLDHRDVAPGKARAAAEKLPGEQWYDWMGRKGEIAETLKLDDPGLVVVTDPQGVIRSISAQREPAALTKL